MSTKKVTTEKTSEPKEGSFKVKTVGANYAASVVGTEERYAKKVTQEEKTILDEKIIAYNKRPSPKKKEEIIALLQPEKVKLQREKEKATAEMKGLKQQSKKKDKVVIETVREEKSLLERLEAEISGDTTGEAVSRVQAILDKFKKVEEKAPAPQVTAYPTRREY